MDELAGKIAVITGSTRGLGLAMARDFARAGAAVVVSGSSPESTQRAVSALSAEGITVYGHTCDVRDEAAIQRLADYAVATFGRFDVWVNNAGVAGPWGATAHIPTERFLAVVRTNILGTYYGSVVALRYFLPRHSGKLINVLGRGARQPVPFQNPYASSKAWIHNFTLAMAKEYKESGVGIYALSPGMMTTDFLCHVSAVAGFEGQLRSLETVIRLLAFPPAVTSRKAVWLASAATDGRTGLVVKTTSTGMMLGSALREGVRRLLGRPAPPLDVTVDAVPPACDA